MRQIRSYEFPHPFLGKAVVPPTEIRIRSYVFNLSRCGGIRGDETEGTGPLKLSSRAWHERTPDIGLQTSVTRARTREGASAITPRYGASGDLGVEATSSTTCRSK